MHARVQDIYDRLDELDPSTFETDASKLLHGLGFDRKMMAKGTKDMSGAILVPAVAGPRPPCCTASKKRLGAMLAVMVPTAMRDGWLQCTETSTTCIWMLRLHAQMPLP